MDLSLVPRLLGEYNTDVDDDVFELSDTYASPTPVPSSQTGSLGLSQLDLSH